MRQGVGYFSSGFSTPLRKAAPTLGLYFMNACSGFSMGSLGCWECYTTAETLRNSSYEPKSPFLSLNHFQRRSYFLRYGVIRSVAAMSSEQKKETSSFWL
ncbi:hypothetical protein F2Q69_00040320 [Brassica cretica]|uniref:Uncharacterized protein n=1 Tax=Brassica cretica TaxID=69181 RepID=A0A8S9N287_BRACR|nr:hypothetical protein F2Q69_00040320 [Brassica cretica]